ncbi:MAG: hypothetical protein Q9219_003572 [cf. Caloplaca sp. 3 TL-2023]
MPYLELRAARMSDLNDFHEMFSDDDVMRYWSSAPYTEVSQTEKYLRNMIDSEWNGLSDFVLEYAPPSELPKVVGKLGLWDGHEIGFMLNRRYWSKGLMREAMSEYLSRIWSNEKMKDLQDIIADVDPRNNACIGLLKRFGFKEIGYREKTVETHLGWCDSLDLALQRPSSSVE